MDGFARIEGLRNVGLKIGDRVFGCNDMVSSPLNGTRWQRFKEDGLVTGRIIGLVRIPKYIKNQQKPYIRVLIDGNKTASTYHQDFWAKLRLED